MAYSLKQKQNTHSLLIPLAHSGVGLKAPMDLLIRRGASLLLQMGAPITWYFKEKAARDATEILFRQNGITGIKLVYSPGNSGVENEALHVVMEKAFSQAPSNTN